MLRVLVEFENGEQAVCYFSKDAFELCKPMFVRYKMLTKKELLECKNILGIKF